MASVAAVEFEIGEEELEEGQVAQLGRVPRRMAEPRPKRLATGRRDREQPPPPAVELAFLGHQPEAGEAGRLLVQERVRE